jgi:hypothetical protein
MPPPQIQRGHLTAEAKPSGRSRRTRAAARPSRGESRQVTWVYEQRAQAADGDGFLRCSLRRAEGESNPCARAEVGPHGATIGGETRGIEGKRRDMKPQVRGPFALIVPGREGASTGLENRCAGLRTRCFLRGSKGCSRSWEPVRIDDPCAHLLRPGEVRGGRLLGRWAAAGWLRLDEDGLVWRSRRLATKCARG